MIEFYHVFSKKNKLTFYFFSVKDLNHIDKNLIKIIFPYFFNLNLKH